MKTTSLNEIKNELEHCTSKELVSLCIRLAKFKKENKELLSYALFEEKFPDEFLNNCKTEMDQQFHEINTTNIYYIKKSIRKILRQVNKHIKFANSKLPETEMLIHLCNNFHSFSIPMHKSPQLMNIYSSQLKRIDAALASLHPDLQYDLLRKLK